MAEYRWFSTCLRLVCLIEPDEAVLYEDSVVVFKAQEFEDAFERCLEIGRAREQEYFNSDGERVRWRLKEVISLDIIYEILPEGTEVYSQPTELEEGNKLSFDTEFKPENSERTQSVYRLPPDFRSEDDC